MSVQSIQVSSKFNKQRVARVIAISTLVIISQNLLPTPKAEANILYNIAEVVSSNYFWDVAKTACGTRCAVAATATNVVVFTYGPTVAQATVEYAKPGLVEMFTNWGSTYVRP